jgi:hypothetical protein
MRDGMAIEPLISPAVLVDFLGLKMFDVVDFG